jgi:hypothetical protein
MARSGMMDGESGSERWLGRREYFAAMLEL